ncbi:DUF4019 domain-containing protein [Ramlibacter tataouinensis]|uniref:DUF4019 domain-containing protein n=1 Tax=Ramlibacter tataouinensis TaxID=94132 RepID=UPI0022F38B69|nr:DUF4019 domain-containing protein [Ramlibacter tataouinensis]WBY02582.1 DUF4019 domain-containing protein [Ramlibacter tataouinensis]
MTRCSPALAAALLGLAIALPAAAQLKVPGPSAAPGLGASTGRAPAAAPLQAASAPQAAASSDVEEKETAGRVAAAGWLTLLDRRDWGTAWESSAAAFRKSVPLANWMDGAPKVRADLGALQERTPATVAYKQRVEGLPPGEYVSVIFLSKFAQREVEEVVTTVREPDGRWRVTGYSTR